jgi:hypothetical protein
MVNGRVAGLPALHTQIGRRGDDPTTTLARHGDRVLLPHAMDIYIDQKRHSFAPPGGLRTNGKVSGLL